MRSRYPLCYACVAFLLLAPLGARALTWRSPRPTVVDPAAAQAGRALFTHEWTTNDPLCAGGDGLGPVYNATSCAACHKQGGVGGAGGLEHNVTMFAMRSRTDGEFRTGVV